MRISRAPATAPSNAPEAERELVIGLAGQLRELSLVADDAPGLERLFPPAYAGTRRGAPGLVLDSVLPYDLDDPLQLGVQAATRRVLVAACRAAHCPGDPVADLAATVRRTGEGVALFEAMVATSRTDPSFADLLPALHDAGRGNPTKLDRYLDSFRRAPPTAPEIFSNATHASASCRDQVFPWGRSDAPLHDPGSGPSPRRRCAPGGRLRPVRPGDRGRLQRRARVPAVAACRAGRDPPTGAAPAVPTLLLAGGRDLSTPEEYARAALLRSPRARLVVVADAGHIVTAHEGKGRAAVRAFLLR